MKKNLAILSLIALAVGLNAYELPFSWLPNPASDKVTNYCVWAAFGTNDFIRIRNTTNTSVTFTNLPRGVVQLRITAEGNGGESEASETELFLLTPPPPRAPVLGTNAPGKPVITTLFSVPIAP